MRLVPALSTPLFAFARDGTIAWLRESGARLVAVDVTNGEVLREVRLDPAPFGIGWRVERHGGVFVVRDDHEIAAYDGATGDRLWKRTSPLHVAFAGEQGGRHVSVVPAPDGDGVDIALADLSTGAFETMLRAPGSMRYVGAHGTLAGELLFFATDERDVLAIDTQRWQIAHRHRAPGSRVLPPVATAMGVHFASIEQRSVGALTHVTTLDRATGALVSSHTMPGAAHRLSAGMHGILLEARRSPNGPVERVAFRPTIPSVRLRIEKHVEVRLMPPAWHPEPAARSARQGHHDVVVPPPQSDDAAPPTETPRGGLLGLLALLDARSDVLVRLADALEADAAAPDRLARLGLTLRDPRARWSTGPGRDPCLLQIAENRDGDAIATYLYPPAKSERVPVVLVSCATREARWLADDLDVWFAGVLCHARAHSPELVYGVLDDLGLSREFPRALVNAIPPPWFFEAHATTWTIDDVDQALADGDTEGAERMLVAAGRAAAGDAGAIAPIKDRLASVYATLGWDHHRATVVETW